MTEEQLATNDTKILLLLHGLLFIGVLVIAPVLTLGLIGTFAGLMSDAPYATPTFKITLLAALTIPVTGFLIGWKYRRKW